MLIPGRPNPTTFECLEAIALREPQRLALVQDNQSWSYQALYLDLVRCIRVLHSLGVKRGDRVAIGMSGFQSAMVLLVASENMGAVTTCFLHANDPDQQQLFALVDWIFSDLQQEAPPTARFVKVDDGFMQKIQAVDVEDTSPLPRVALEMHEHQRLSRTSGSTGRSKFMLLSRQAQEYWVTTAVTTCGLRRDSRLLVLGPLVLNGTFARASACLRIGAAVMDLSRPQLAAYGITHIAGLPLQIEQLIASLPPGFSPRQPVDVFTVGGFLAPSVRQLAARTFAGRVLSRYGMNEASGVCDDIDATGVGVLAAGADIKIVDLEGREVPHGEPGTIAVRTPGMVEGYMGEPEATREAFRDGWFHSGDWGTLIAPRVLRLAGRHDDLINVGGIKVPANVVEAQVREVTQPRDCAVLATNLDAGATTLGIAIVPNPGDSQDELRRKLAAELRLGTPVGARVLFLDTVPRLRSGKVDRVALQRLFESPPSGSA